jgi:hypothetical protein
MRTERCLCVCLCAFACVCLAVCAFKFFQASKRVVTFDKISNEYHRVGGIPNIVLLISYV